MKSTNIKLFSTKSFSIAFNHWIFKTFLLFIIGLTSCSPWPSEVNRALKLAGENRAELEKVLQYYHTIQPDSLKLKAAEFLISNMDAHFSYESKSWDNFQLEMESLFKREDGAEQLTQVCVL